MRSDQYIQLKQQAWAQRNGLKLQGSGSVRGALNYTLSVEENVFGNALHESVRAAFDAGAGGELKGEIPRISALHSSAALAVNLFQYWIVNGDFSGLAKILDVPSRNIATGQFEDEFPVCANPKACGFNEPPHLDFAFRYANGGCIGVECKMFEPYSSWGHATLPSVYLALSEAWKGLPACRALAARMSGSSSGFRRLDVSQLLKHILGLRYCLSAERVRLLYLYYDAIGIEATEHRQEIERFQSEISGDPVDFIAFSVQAFIGRAVRRARETHQAYVDYLSERYL